MAHVLILGVTLSGKTYLAKKLAREFQRRKKTVAVLDPLKNKWAADFQTDDRDEFLIYCKTRPGLMVFVDESGDAFEHQKDELTWLAYRGRHFGHSCFFIAQRATQIPKIVRDQCSTLYLFASSVSDSDTHAEEWLCDQLIDAPRLRQGEFFLKARFAEPQRGRINFGTGKITLSTIDKI